MSVVTQIQVRRGTASQWTTADTVLSSGEWGFETDTGKVKIGDGTTAWTALGYTGAGDNRTSPASVYAIPFDVDTRDGYQLGGFYAYFNNRYHLSTTTPMQDIIDAFNNL
jgi:hypothetical protein